jgi:tetraacyldisaccharide 4'-kinase
LTQVRALLSGEIRALEDFRGKPVHAIAGIGNPSAFFDALTAAGLQADVRALDDHARLTRDDLIFPDDAPVLMTEKDAVKCLGLADARHWAVAMDIELSEADAAVVHSLLEAIATERSGWRIADGG